MPIFRYKVRDKDGATLSGTLEGTDVSTIVERLDALGYIPIIIEESKGGKTGAQGAAASRAGSSAPRRRR